MEGKFISAFIKQQHHVVVHALLHMTAVKISIKYCKIDSSKNNQPQQNMKRKKKHLVTAKYFAFLWKLWKIFSFFLWDLKFLRVFQKKVLCNKVFSLVFFLLFLYLSKTLTAMFSSSLDIC